MALNSSSRFICEGAIVGSATRRAARCVYRKPKPEHNGDGVRRGRELIRCRPGAGWRGRILVERPMRPYPIIVCGILHSMRYTSMESGADAPRSIRLWSAYSRRIDPISRSAKQFCQAESGATGLSRMPMARNRRVMTVP